MKQAKYLSIRISAYILGNELHTHTEAKEEAHRKNELEAYCVENRVQAFDVEFAIFEVAMRRTIMQYS